MGGKPKEKTNNETKISFKETEILLLLICLQFANNYGEFQNNFNENDIIKLMEKIAKHTTLVKIKKAKKEITDEQRNNTTLRSSSKNTQPKK